MVILDKHTQEFKNYDIIIYVHYQFEHISSHILENLASNEKGIFFSEYYPGHFVICWQVRLAAQNIFFIVFPQYIFNQEEFFLF